MKVCWPAEVIFVPIAAYMCPGVSCKETIGVVTTSQTCHSCGTKLTTKKCILMLCDPAYFFNAHLMEQLFVQINSTTPTSNIFIEPIKFKLTMHNLTRAVIAGAATHISMSKSNPLMLQQGQTISPMLVLGKQH